MAYYASSSVKLRMRRTGRNNRRVKYIADLTNAVKDNFEVRYFINGVRIRTGLVSVKAASSFSSFFFLERTRTLRGRVPLNLYVRTICTELHFFNTFPHALASDALGSLSSLCYNASDGLASCYFSSFAVGAWRRVCVVVKGKQQQRKIKGRPARPPSASAMWSHRFLACGTLPRVLFVYSKLPNSTHNDVILLSLLGCDNFRVVLTYSGVLRVAPSASDFQLELAYPTPEPLYAYDGAEPF